MENKIFLDDIIDNYEIYRDWLDDFFVKHIVNIDFANDLPITVIVTGYCEDGKFYIGKGKSLVAATVDLISYLDGIQFIEIPE